ncbi:MAG: undecaprenyl/decaprenyl-phosphate alpha-N-acetylglucosaminyl 1-phosphate transferase [Flavobacteriales bacterium]|nr:undecaprenyl/decaprenyl-phosphate alpha-N-acetylglucosaminyl 1-phosphate transferase [Flavobacteriales bacterium]
MSILLISLGFFTALVVVVIATPTLIKVAKLKHLVDEPGEERKLHSRSVPTIGGVIIFSSILFSYSLWFPDTGDDLHRYIREYKYIIASLVILFFVGVKDDIIGTAPIKKLLAHIVVAFILVMMGETQIKGMHGLFGIWDIPEWARILLSVFVYIVIVNAFNLIDGVDGLASGIGFITSVFFGTWFALVGNSPMALLSFILAGSLLGFLLFNFSPAKIFMGDSGSLTIGCIISVLVIHMIETPASKIPDFLLSHSVPVLAMSILVYPLIDTLRVFIVRALNGQSPFSADKNHLHHRLIASGFSHAKTVLILYAYNIVVVLSAFAFGFLNHTLAFFLSLGTAVLLASLFFAIPSKKNEI